MKHLIKTCTLLFALLVLVGCERERLSGEEKILTGTWNWSHTYVKDYCSGFIEYHHFDPSNLSATYQIIISRWGKLEFVKDGTVISTHGIKIDYAHIPKKGIVESNKNIMVNLILDNDPKKTLYFLGTPKEMRINYFPITPETECNTYPGNFFVKEY